MNCLVQDVKTGDFVCADHLLTNCINDILDSDYMSKEKLDKMIALTKRMNGLTKKRMDVELL